MRPGEMTPNNFDLFFAPDNPIITAEDFTQELLKFARQQHKQITVLKQSMEPVIELDGETYRCKLANPFRSLSRLLQAPSFEKAQRPKWVYLFQLEHGYNGTER